MSFFDSAKDMADQAVDKVGADKVNDGLDKAGEMVDDKTGGKFSDQIDSGVEKAQEAVEGMDDNN